MQALDLAAFEARAAEAEARLTALESIASKKGGERRHKCRKHGRKLSLISMAIYQEPPDLHPHQI
jgi:hypothetical protein